MNNLQDIVMKEEEEAITISVDRTMWQEKVNEIALRATLLHRRRL